jgi:hypothetical protein
MRYDPSTNGWSDAPADPPAGMGDGASLVWAGGNYLYALRGEFLEDSALYDVWRYSLTENVWTTMADIPAYPHSGGVGGVGDGGSLLYVGFWLSNYTDYIYALSGNQAYPETPAIPDNRTYRYSISKNSWGRLADLPFGVGYYVGCRLGYADGNIYAWQGAPSTWPDGGDDLTKYKLPTDPNPPTIRFPSRTPSDDVVPGQIVVISVNVTDTQSGVKNVTLYFTITNGSTWENRLMTLNTSTALYEDAIPGQQANTLVKYKIRACDNAGNVAVEDNAGQYYVYAVIPEFPSAMILPLLMSLAIVAVILAKRGFPKKPGANS